MTPDVAMLLYELMNPRDSEHSESELDEQAEAIKARLDLNESWEEATETGYKGPRGQYWPEVLVPELVSVEMPSPIC